MDEIIGKGVMAVRKRRTDGEAGAVVAPAALLWGLVFAFGLLLATAAVMGSVAHFSPWQATPGALETAGYGSIALAGWLAARRAPRAGWLHGGIVGLLFLLTASWLLVPEFPWLHWVSPSGLVRAALAFLAGAAGGMAARLR